MLSEEYIPATATYNYMMKDPLLDWFKYHNHSLCDQLKEVTNKNKKYHSLINSTSKNEYNFTQYMMDQGKEFERKIMKMIIKKFTPDRIREINGEEDPRNPSKFKETKKAMEEGVPIIHSGVLHNHKNKTFGIPDLLIRSDWLKYLVEESPIDKKDEKHNGKYYYVVVDIKFTGLLLRADATHLLNSASFPAYKAQLLIYNWALGQVQDYTPNQVYILGRRWKYTSKGETYTGNKCFEKLGIIDYATIDKEYVTQTKNALKWLNEVRSDDAKNWDISNYPLERWELYPNMCNSHDYPWRAIKENLAKSTGELTSLWMVGPKNRNIALENDICQWTDPDCDAKALGITGEKTSKILNEIIGINQNKKDKIRPKLITNNVGQWKVRDDIEFFVDFETCNGVVTDIKNLPYAKNDTIIFMIGVGYIDPETEKWVYKNFTVDRLTNNEEERICNEFAEFIHDKADEYDIVSPKCYHWSHAENTMWADALERINKDILWSWHWVDLLEVFKEEPIVIKGCMAFGLKEVASAMKKHGFILTSWDKKSSCVDGQSAMIAAIKANNEAKYKNKSMKKISIVKQIIKYNEVDVKVLYEILDYLRKNHVINNKRVRKGEQKNKCNKKYKKR